MALRNLRPMVIKSENLASGTLSPSIIREHSNDIIIDLVEGR
jgi:hypothetical protein